MSISDIPSDSNSKVYAGKLASDASTQYVLIKSDNVQKPTTTSLSRHSSSTSISLSRHSTSDFSADKLMERDPVESLRPTVSIPQESQEKLVIEQQIPLTIEQVNDEELNLAIQQSINEEQLAIQKSLELSPVKDNTNEEESSSSSTDSDGKLNFDNYFKYIVSC